MTSSRIALSLLLLASLAACGGRRARAQSQLGVVSSDEALQVMAPTGPTIGCSAAERNRGALLMECPALDGSGTTVGLRIEANDRGDAFTFSCASGVEHIEACRAIYDRLRLGPTGGGEATPASETGAETTSAPAEG